jgi:hypothetical protein
MDIVQKYNSFNTVSRVSSLTQEPPITFGDLNPPQQKHFDQKFIHEITTWESHFKSAQNLVWHLVYINIYMDSHISCSILKILNLEEILMLIKEWFRFKTIFIRCQNRQNNDSNKMTHILEAVWP